MLPKEIIEMLEKLIAEKMEVDVLDVIPRAELVNDLGAESLGIMDLIASIEGMFDFDIDISDEEVGKIKTVQDLFDLVEKKI